MEHSLRLVPNQQDKSASVNDTAGTLGLHDTFRHGPRSLAAEVITRGTIQHRLENWEETQDNLKLTLQRNIYGMHAPMRLLMERKIVASNPHMPALSRSNVHLDVLMGRDETIEFFDVFHGAEGRPPLEIHNEMEKKLKL